MKTSENTYDAEETALRLMAARGLHGALELTKYVSQGEVARDDQQARFYRAVHAFVWHQYIAAGRIENIVTSLVEMHKDHATSDVSDLLASKALISDLPAIRAALVPHQSSNETNASDEAIAWIDAQD